MNDRRPAASWIAVKAQSVRLGSLVVIGCVTYQNRNPRQRFQRALPDDALRGIVRTAPATNRELPPAAALTNFCDDSFNARQWGQGGRFNLWFRQAPARFDPSAMCHSTLLDVSNPAPVRERVTSARVVNCSISRSYSCVAGKRPIAPE